MRFDIMVKDKKDEHINNILKDIRKNIKPPTGPLASIDLKKLKRAEKDVKIVKEVEEIVKKPHEECDE